MKDRITIWFRNRELWGAGVKITYRCTHSGCSAEISTLRFLLLGCECRMHRWLRRWGGLES